MSFAGDINKFNLRLTHATDETIEAVELELFSSIIYDSPVDKGRFRGNWQVSFDAPKGGTLQDIDKTGSATIAKAKGVIGSRSGGRLTYFVNNLPYSVPLEYGHSRQAPAGMVRKNAQRFIQIVNDKANAHKL